MAKSRLGSLRAVAAGILAALLLTTLVQPAVAAPDTTGPELVSSFITPLALDTTSGPVAVDVTVRLTDATGVAPAKVVLDKGYAYQYRTAMLSLSSGTTQNGVWKARLFLGPEADAGTWYVRLLDVKDVHGNVSFAATPILRRISVTSPAVDGYGPITAGTYIVPTAVDVTAKEAVIDLNFRLQDQTAVAPPTVEIVQGETRQSVSAQMVLSSGTAQNGVWKAKLVVPRGSAPGDWAVWLRDIKDSYGNAVSDRWIRTIKVASNFYDAEGPAFVSTYITPEAPDVTSAEAIVDVNVRLTDQTGVAQGTVRFVNTKTQQTHLADLALSSGTVHDGVWKARVLLPRGAAPGEWSVFVSDIRDTSGNIWPPYEDMLRTIMVTSN